MQKRVALPALFLAGSIAGAALLTADDATSGGPAKSAAVSAERTVTPVTGPSWLNHLNINFADTSLGRGAGRYGPGPNEPRPAERGSASRLTGKPAVLTRADLYRLNCQACHRAEGTGAPPEIRSLLSLVQ